MNNHHESTPILDVSWPNSFGPVAKYKRVSTQNHHSSSFLPKALRKYIPEFQKGAHHSVVDIKKDHRKQVNILNGRLRQAAGLHSERKDHMHMRNNSLPLIRNMSEFRLSDYFKRNSENSDEIIQ